MTVTSQSKGLLRQKMPGIEDRFRMVRIGDKRVTLEMPVLSEEEIQRYIASEYGRHRAVE